MVPLIVTVMKIFLISLVLIICCFVALLYLFQRKLVYFPESFRTPPQEAGLFNVEEIKLKTSDGETLISWYLKAKPGKPTLIYFHGNGGALRYRAERFLLHEQNGTGLLMMSYRGYGGSTGSPSEKNNISDALIVYDWLKTQGIPSSHIILYGESLGTGVATQVAAQRDAAGVILEAPYTSLTEIGEYAYPLLPVRLLMIDRYETKNYISKIDAPLLILHGQHDFVIPIKFGRDLFHQAKEPKNIIVFPKGMHSDLYLHGAWKNIVNFIRKLPNS